MTDVERNWKRSRKTEEEEGPALLEEKAVGGGEQAGEMQGPPPADCLESGFGGDLSTGRGHLEPIQVD